MSKIVLALSGERRGDEAAEERVYAWFGTRLEFGVMLNAHEERALRQLHGFHEPAVRREAGERQPRVAAERAR